MGRILALIIGLPVSVAIVALAVANRKPVMLSLDPFTPDAPALAVTLPLFALVFAGVIFGLVLGGLLTWLRQGRYRREARRARRDLTRAEARRDSEIASGTGLPALRR
ncbi:lipopolysaccharide assembly protein LapA domain-containing protein [Azorhizobium doebereinerae]|uniref:lipopolysaccharide assembly protein LapA domain-containing protein n=1 Tax=Azorhizobium doebereinerae TaxID=281091 RepID=UPI000412EF77|nr:lipopolysaccharide assembly protein LapA domain-containing protein [Azorhizobium doebereinerae]